MCILMKLPHLTFLDHVLKTFSRPVYCKAVFAVGDFGQNCNRNHCTDGIDVHGSTFLLTSDNRSGTDMAKMLNRIISSYHQLLFQYSPEYNFHMTPTTGCTCWNALCYAALNLQLNQGLLIPVLV